MNYQTTKMAAAAVLALAAMTGAASAADVSITLNGVRAGGGPLYVRLQTRDEFMQEARTRSDVIKTPEAGAATFEFKNVPDGEYAVSVWHDVNGNGEFDRGPGGWPLDGWSMFNAASLMGPPTFDAVKFEASGHTAISLDMIYAD